MSEEKFLVTTEQVARIIHSVCLVKKWYAWENLSDQDRAAYLDVAACELADYGIEPVVGDSRVIV